MFEKYKDKGFKVLAFPANNFGNQEPGSNSEIKTFCTGKKVTFDLFAKVSVKGEDQCPLYRYLTKHPDKAIAGDLPWNFTKYLIGRDGAVLAKWGPKTLPDDKTIVEAVEKALAAERPKGG
jgi:glutathione peroxidase